MLKNRKSPVKKSRSSSPKRGQKKSSQISTRGPALAFDENIWPIERDVLFRPDRFKYVRKLVKPKGCVFCEAHRMGVKWESLCLYKSQHSMVLLNKFPYNSGHLLVIPQNHKGDLTDLTSQESRDLHETLRIAVKALQKVYQPGGINVGLNQGAVAGAGIPEHLHYHIIPRWAGDLNFFPLVAETKTVIESLEMTYDRLILYFKKIN